MKPESELKDSPITGCQKCGQNATSSGGCHCRQTDCNNLELLNAIVEHGKVKLKEGLDYLEESERLEKKVYPAWIEVGFFTGRERAIAKQGFDSGMKANSRASVSAVLDEVMMSFSKLPGATQDGSLHSLEEIISRVKEKEDFKG